MDIASIVGLLLAILLILGTIAVSPGAPFGAFIDYGSMFVVVGGASAAILMCFPLKTVLSLASVTKNAFFNKDENLVELIEQIVSLAETARRDGLLALESRLDEIDNAFVVLGIQMAVDGTQPEIIEDVMRTEIEAVTSRHKDGRAMLDQLGRFAPAFGMIGTLMGLIMMLGNMDDPDALGPGMAVALITTLYGAIIANVFALPFAEKLRFIDAKELVFREIVVRGIMGIQSGDNPRVIQQKLFTYVPPKYRDGQNEVA